MPDMIPIPYVSGYSSFYIVYPDPAWLGHFDPYICRSVDLASGVYTGCSLLKDMNMQQVRRLSGSSMKRLKPADRD